MHSSRRSLFMSLCLLLPIVVAHPSAHAGREPRRDVRSGAPLPSVHLIVSPHRFRRRLQLDGYLNTRYMRRLVDRDWQPTLDTGTWTDEYTTSPGKVWVRRDCGGGRIWTGWCPRDRAPAKVIADADALWPMVGRLVSLKDGQNRSSCMVGMLGRNLPGDASWGRRVLIEAHEQRIIRGEKMWETEPLVYSAWEETWTSLGGDVPLPETPEDAIEEVRNGRLYRRRLLIGPALPGPVARVVNDWLADEETLPRHSDRLVPWG
jgi:hypothetical protein